MVDDLLPGFRFRRDPDTGERLLEVSLTGDRLIEMPMFNKGTAFAEEERDVLGLRGLLPPRVVDFERQMDRVLWGYEQQESDLERYLHMMAVLDRNETLFYRLFLDHFERMLPIVYTPTVGLACQNFGRIFRRSRGLYISPDDIGQVDEILGRWRYPNVRVVVVTDGERVLGLGDLGAGGMGISIGKASLYVAAGGIHPAYVLPVCLDVGTDRVALRDEPLYHGLRRPRLRGAEYDQLVQDFLDAVARRYPRAVVQFEDFASVNALRLLEANRERVCCFNDDIQGTGAVARAAVLSGLRGTGRGLKGLRVVIAGAGSAGVGIAESIPEADIRIVDDNGLLSTSRKDLTSIQRPLARDEPMESLETVIRNTRPHALIGVTGSPGLFTREMIEAMEGPHPLIMPLSNPTSLAECTPQQALEWSGGLARIATGSPFAGVAQCNNVYIFPGLGLGVMLSEAQRVTDGMLYAAAEALAAMSPPDRLLPVLGEIRTVSRGIALAVARRARVEGLARIAPEVDLEARLAEIVWEPDYVRYVPAI